MPAGARSISHEGQVRIFVADLDADFAVLLDALNAGQHHGNAVDVVLAVQQRRSAGFESVEHVFESAVVLIPDNIRPLDGAALVRNAFKDVAAVVAIFIMGVALAVPDHGTQLAVDAPDVVPGGVAAFCAVVASEGIYGAVVELEDRVPCAVAGVH